MTEPHGEIFHPQYKKLHAEPLARPFPAVSGLVMVSHRVFFFESTEATEHSDAVAKLAELTDVETATEENGVQILRLGKAELRIEPHTEFTAFTVLAPQSGAPFAESAMDHLPENFLKSIPGRIIAAVEIASEQIAVSEVESGRSMDRVSAIFGRDRLVGAWVVERVASVWSHFRPDECRATRFLVQGHRLTPGRYGRLLQRLVEIETYRMAALLGLPIGRESLSELETLEAQHVALIGRISAMESGDGCELLDVLTNLTLATARLETRCRSRIGYTRSYSRILAARLRELREEQVPGYQTISEFFERRLPQSWHTCEISESRLSSLSAGLKSTAALLRTRIELNSQNRYSDSSAYDKRRITAQLRLLHCAQALSVVLLAYYLVKLLKLLLDGAKAATGSINAYLAVTLLLAFVALGGWWMARKAGKFRR